MLKNNNQTVVKRLSDRSLKQNRTRNIFIILAIVLTTFMFTTVFTIGFSLAKNMSIFMLRQQGTKTTITLNQPSKEQAGKAGQCNGVYAVGQKLRADMIDVDNGNGRINLDYYDDTEFKKNFLPAISDVNGTYPDSEDEVMLSIEALKSLNITTPKIGMEVQVILESGQQAFSLSGWFTDYSYQPDGNQGFISLEYANHKGLSLEKDGVLCISAKAGKQGALYEDLQRQVTLKSGQAWNTSYDVQTENNGNAVAIVAAVCLIGGIIVVSGYLLIYNVMYISVTKDIRFYGMLKTIGTSPSQIKRIVRRQGWILSIVGIPLGMLLGTLMSFWAVPFVLNNMFATNWNRCMPTNICFNPIIYIGTILFAVLTIILSCRKPARMAGKVSPVEALKYNGIKQVKTKEKRSTAGGKIYRMAFRNVFREKKRALLVFASLFMGTMAFLSVNTFVGSLKLDNYVKYYIPYDYTIYTSTGAEDVEENNNVDRLAAAEKLIEDIKVIDGVERVSVNRSADVILDFDENIYAPFLENAEPDQQKRSEMIEFYKAPEEEEFAYSSPVIAVGIDMIKQYNQQAKTPIDIDKFQRGEICLVGFVGTEQQSAEVIGKQITMTDKNSRKTKSFTVGSCPARGDDHGLEIGYYWMKGGAPDIILISEQAINELTGHPTIDNILVNCNPKAESAVTTQIKKLTDGNICVRKTDVKSEVIADFKSSMMTMNVLGVGISAVLILIGIINFVNVMLTGVYTRRGELAVMESVGMTKKQIKKMLTYEGFFYGIITIGLILTIGNVIIYIVAIMSQEIDDYAVFNYPIAWMIGIAVVIMAVCMIVPAIVYTVFSRESITEQLKDNC